MKRITRIFFRCCHEFLLEKLRIARETGKVGVSLYCKECKREYKICYFSVSTQSFVIQYQKYIYLFSSKKDSENIEYASMEPLMPLSFAVIQDVNKLIDKLVESGIITPQGADLYIGAFQDVKDYIDEMKCMEGGKAMMKKDFRAIELLTIFMEKTYEKNKIALLKMRAKSILNKRKEQINGEQNA